MRWLVLLVTGWPVLRRASFARFRLARIDVVLLFLVYLDPSATRIAIENGPITLFVFLFVLLAVIGKNSPLIVAGENLRLFFELFDQPGGYLARFFKRFLNHKLLTEIPCSS
jgi:hypothetical protein